MSKKEKQVKEQEIPKQEIEKRNFKKDFSACLFHLLTNEPFFAALSRFVVKKENRGIPTLGVSFNKDLEQFEMLYNPDFFFGLPLEQKIGILKHEFYHIIFNHFGRLKSYGVDFKKCDSDTKNIWNVALDLAINCHIPENELPTKGCIPGKNIFENMPPFKTAEWYYVALNKDEQFKQKVLKAYGQGKIIFIDEHGNMTNEDGTEVDKILKETIKKIIKKSAKECRKQWGSVSQQVVKEIDKITGNAIIDAKRLLKYFIQASQKAERKTSIRRINKRFPYVFPGTKANRQATVAISVDQSGSVGDNLLAQFFKILEDFSEIATFTFIPFDSEIYESEIIEWKKGKKINLKRVLQGGTNFDSPTKWVNDHKKKFDGHIILTDMQAPKPISSLVPRIWVTCESAALSPPFQTREKICYIPESNQ